MSELLSYLSKELSINSKSSVDEIISKWKSIGLLDGIQYYEDRARTAIAFEVIFIMSQIYYDSIKVNEYEGESRDRFYTVIFPIVRVVINKSKNEESYKHILEIESIARRMLNSKMAKNLAMGIEDYCIDFWDNVMDKHNGWIPLNEYLSKIKNRFVSRGLIDELKYKSIMSLIDWEAEYTSYVANTIVKIMDDKIKK